MKITKKFNITGDAGFPIGLGDDKLSMCFFVSEKNDFCCPGNLISFKSGYSTGSTIKIGKKIAYSTGNGKRFFVPQNKHAKRFTPEFFSKGEVYADFSSINCTTCCDEPESIFIRRNYTGIALNYEYNEKRSLSNSNKKGIVLECFFPYGNIVVRQFITKELYRYLAFFECAPFQPETLPYYKFFAQKNDPIQTSEQYEKAYDIIDLHHPRRSHYFETTIIHRIFKYDKDFMRDMPRFFVIKDKELQTYIKEMTAPLKQVYNDGILYKIRAVNFNVEPAYPESGYFAYINLKESIFDDSGEPTSKTIDIIGSLANRFRQTEPTDSKRDLIALNTRLGLQNINCFTFVGIWVSFDWLNDRSEF